jgi:cyanoexosortase B-associated protein
MSAALQSWSRLFRQLQMRRTALVLLLFAIALMGAVPSYFSGQWPWSTPPKVETIDQVRAIRQEGLPLSDWQTLE